MVAIAIVALFCVSIFGVRSLLIFSSRNGLFRRLEKATTTGHTPSGQLLRPLTSNGRYPKIDRQITAVCVFFLLYCEDWSVPETSLAGFSFVGAWGASWALIILDSLRTYSQNSLLSWISIPGILIFNYSHAIITPLYLAFRLALTPAPTLKGIFIEPTHLRVFPWAFSASYCVPVLLISLPSFTTKGVNSKHTFAGWYQQWNLYISLSHYLLLLLWKRHKPQASQISIDEASMLLREAYGFIFGLAAAAHWVPILAALAELVRRGASSKKVSPSLNLRSTFIPASPFSNRKAKSASEGGRWLIQWDTFTGTLATTVWATSLYLQANRSLEMSIPFTTILARALWLALLGGPMGVPVGLLWWRDELILRSVGGMGLYTSNTS